ncbi:MAG: formate dehydrogenase accessory sulfurtransferase FdhD [Gammaproteobacteria bacterium]|nr:formate dehydrogenase accessory sulfurtransferase FdhD [Gammaproteobacteria bacterium]
MTGGAIIEVPAVRWADGRLQQTCDAVANETGLALVYNGQPFAVMMVTPVDIEDFVLGFSLSEGVIARPDELLRTRIGIVPDGIEANVEIAARRYRTLDLKERMLSGRVGCGLCGAQTLAQAMRHPAPVARSLAISSSALHDGMAWLSRLQPLNARTGALHAAGWLDPHGRLLLAREDVGRHNALDKLIGALARTRPLPLGGSLLITSRASHEIVQKAAVVGIEIVCAISAPTALAVRVAEETRITLVGFAREGRYTAYAHGDRIHPQLMERASA